MTLLTRNRILASDDPSFWIKQFCDDIETGKTPDQETNENLARMLRAALVAVGKIRLGDKKRADKIGKAVAVNLGLIDKRGRKGETLELLNDRLEIIRYYENLKNDSPEDALALTAKKFRTSPRTIQRHYQKYKGSLTVERRISKGSETWRQAFRTLDRITREAKQAKRAINPHVPLSLGDSSLIVRRLTDAQEKELMGMTWNLADSGPDKMRAVDWWFSSSVYEDLNADEPVGEQIRLSETRAGNCIIFIEALRRLYDL